MARIGYTPGDVAELLEVSTRNVRLLIEQEVITPSVPARGRGRPRLFNHPDLVEVGVAFKLREAGIAPRSLVIYLAAYRKARANHLAQRGDSGASPAGVATELLYFGLYEEDIDSLKAWIMEQQPEDDSARNELQRELEGLVVTVSVNLRHLRADLESRLSRLDRAEEH